MILDRSTPLTLSETMGALLAAVIDAQAQAARSTVEFIDSVGFAEGEDSQVRALRTATFGFRKLDENNQLEDFSLEVPLLALVNIPLITVRKATIAFSYDVTDTAPAAEATPGTGSPAPGLPVVRSATLSGKLVKQSRATTSGAAVERKGSLDVTIELEQADLPVGLERVLDMLELASREAKVPTPNE